MGSDFERKLPKSELRQEARARRAELALACPDFAARIAIHAGDLKLEAGARVGGYAALPGEADPRLLLARLEQQGCILLYPRVAAKDGPLSFHRIPPGQAMAKGAFGVPEPAADWPVLRPNLVLVPLLAFDGTGTRLGYGGGYYDRTLAALPGVRAIGVGYAGQEVERLPYEAHDWKLDMVLTEKGMRRFA